MEEKKIRLKTPHISLKNEIASAEELDKIQEEVKEAVEASVKICGRVPFSPPLESAFSKIFTQDQGGELRIMGTIMSFPRYHYPCYVRGNASRRKWLLMGMSEFSRDFGNFRRMLEELVQNVPRDCPTRPIFRYSSWKLHRDSRPS